MTQLQNIDWERILEQFQSPGRYLGTEPNAYPRKPGTKRFLLCFPDDYTIGMSSLGFHTVGNIINSHPGFSCERCFSPWSDMERWLRNNNVELFSMETKSPVKDFDILGFSFHYELSYTNFLNMLDLAGIEPFRAKRVSSGPLIIGGGPTCVNPEILTNFLDLIVVGEAEPVLGRLLDTYLACADKKIFLSKAAEIEGVFVPGISEKVKVAVFEEFDNRHYPARFPVALIDIPHNRINIEINRGCRNNCRFCQATVIYSPYRQKTRRQVLDISSQCVASTGYDEIALTSLSSTDHPELLDIMDDLHYGFRDLGVSVVMSSMRPESFSKGLADRLARLRRGGLTFAPETPCRKLKKIINKDMDNTTILKAIRTASERGWNKIKLYFMVGLPGENIEDVDEIPGFIRKVKAQTGVSVNVTVSCLIPQAHTPFQWLNNQDPEILKDKVSLVRRKSPAKIKRVNWGQHIVESILARADRSLSGVVYTAWKNGARFDQWDEHFDFNIWDSAFLQNDTTWKECYFKDFHEMDKLPWEYVETGVKSEFLRKSYEMSMSMACEVK